jgi:hypothetical protein
MPHNYDIQHELPSQGAYKSCILLWGGVRGLLQKPKRYAIGRLQVKKSDAG